MQKVFKLEKIREIAQELIEKIENDESNKSFIIALSGDLGAGKTTLTQEIGHILGIKEKIVSPTFVIMRKYNLTNKKFEKLIHVDAYRLKNSEDLMKLGWEELIKRKNLIIIEWPELVPECLNGKNVLNVSLAHMGNKTRIIKI